MLVLHKVGLGGTHVAIYAESGAFERESVKVSGNARLGGLRTPRVHVKRHRLPAGFGAVQVLQPHTARQGQCEGKGGYDADVEHGASLLHG